ncbi:MAG TPA: hypothetical protein VE709_07370 [Pseudonocardiaceae bacterium]|nr:hypothetical protein [Pseudonocardiaceae bacterium]
MTYQQPSTSGISPPIEKSSRKSDLSFAKVSAAALAAITAAVLGWTIGVAGTVIGAALASVITTVSSAFYQRSLERSRERVRLLAAKTMPLPRQRAEPAVPQPGPPSRRSRSRMYHSRRRCRSRTYSLARFPAPRQCARAAPCSVLR